MMRERRKTMETAPKKGKDENDQDVRTYASPPAAVRRMVCLYAGTRFRRARQGGLAIVEGQQGTT